MSSTICLRTATSSLSSLDDDLRRARFRSRERGSVGADVSLACGMDDGGGPARVSFPFEAEAQIECDRQSSLLADDGSVSKHGELLLSRPSGHRAGDAPGFPNGRAAIVSISASDCHIDLAIHKSQAIEAGDAEPALVLGEAERLRPHERDVCSDVRSWAVSERSARAAPRAQFIEAAVKRRDVA